MSTGGRDDDGVLFESSRLKLTRSFALTFTVAVVAGEVDVGRVDGGGVGEERIEREDVEGERGEIGVCGEGGVGCDGVCEGSCSCGGWGC